MTSPRMASCLLSFPKARMTFPKKAACPLSYLMVMACDSYSCLVRMRSCLLVICPHNLWPMASCRQERTWLSILLGLVRQKQHFWPDCLVVAAKARWLLLTEKYK
jgi:hypothetical protein